VPASRARSDTQRTHARETVVSGRTQRAQQEGLGLVVAMMRGQQHLILAHPFRKRGVSRRAGCGFEPEFGDALDLDAHDIDRDGQRGAPVATALGPPCRIRMQTVIDVDRAQVEPQFMTQRRGRCGSVRESGRRRGATTNRCCGDRTTKSVKRRVHGSCPVCHRGLGGHLWPDIESVPSGPQVALLQIPIKAFAKR
jgi:hypothetical protein